MRTGHSKPLANTNDTPEGVDCIQHQPDPIIQYIASYLPPQDIANLRLTALRYANNKDIINFLLSLAVCPKIAGGHSHSLALAADGSVFAWGCNHYNQLGLGAGAVRKQYTPVKLLLNLHPEGLQKLKDRLLVLTDDQSHRTQFLQILYQIVDLISS